MTATGLLVNHERKTSPVKRAFFDHFAPNQEGYRVVNITFISEGTVRVDSLPKEGVGRTDEFVLKDNQWTYAHRIGWYIPWWMD